MERKWRHEVSTDWLKARKEFLTASEVKSLVPEYKRFLKAQDPDKIMPGFCGLWAEKTGEHIGDAVSFNAMARGHIMESYAIEDYNMLRKATMGHHYHWDDVILHRDGLGYSPDALNVRQPNSDSVSIEVTEDGYVYVGAKPTSMLEIKSYEPKAHLKKFLESPTEMEEAYQVAMAFKVLPSLKVAALVFYCPSCSRLTMFENVYTRSMLDKQLEMIDGIHEQWKRTCKWCEGTLQSTLKASMTEEEIYDDWLGDMYEVPNEPVSAFILRG